MSIRLFIRTVGMCLFGALMISTIATGQSREEHNRELIQEIVREKLRVTPEQLEQMLQHQQSGAQAEQSEEWLTEGPIEDGVVSADERPESEIHAAVNPSDNNNIVVSAMRYGTGTSGLTMPIYVYAGFRENME